jgi:two-component system response regulator MprA
VGNGFRIVVAEDERAVRESLTRALTLEGYNVTAVSDGAQALEALRSEPADVVVLDVMMPVVDGLTACRVLRSEKNRVPILMVTARTETSDRVAGLDAGADDYLPALLRRSQPDDAVQPSSLSVGDLRLDSAARRVWVAEIEVDLSKTEFDLLELLVRNSGIVLDQSTIYERIWGYDFGPDSKNLAVYIGYLRRKIDTDGRPPLIHTVRGVGYTVRSK